MLLLLPCSMLCGSHQQVGRKRGRKSSGAAGLCITLWAVCCAGAFTFSVPTEVGFGVEADPNPPRLMGAPFAADLHASHCYAILPCGQVRQAPALSATMSCSEVQ